MERKGHYQHGGTIFSVSNSPTMKIELLIANLPDVYTAATVLIAGRLCSAVQAEIPVTSITRSWNCALEILRKYQSYSKSAQRCIAALEILYDQVVSDEPPLLQQSYDEDAHASAGSMLNNISFGEGMNGVMMEGIELPDFQDMSWLNSVPSHLF